jgi:hypothetical protein
MKTYTSPQLVCEGEVIAGTRTVMSGSGDPEGNLKLAPTGTLGFLL